MIVLTTCRRPWDIPGYRTRLYTILDTASPSVVATSQDDPLAGVYQTWCERNEIPFTRGGTPLDLAVTAHTALILTEASDPWDAWWFSSFLNTARRTRLETLS